MDKEYYKDLSTKAADGDAKAFSKLYEMIYREMYYIAFYTLADDKDAVEAVIGAARDGFNAIGRLHTEEAFEVFMMKTLCARIKMRLKEYGDDLTLDSDQPELKHKLFTLDGTDRLCAVLHIAGRLDAAVIAAYTGMMKGSVKKRLSNALPALTK